jgi:C4-dicarboxylate transporter DctM subunit
MLAGCLEKAMEITGYNLIIAFGLNLFVATGITGMKMAKLVPAVMVYVLVNIIALLIITYIPEVSMFIPNLAYK